MSTLNWEQCDTPLSRQEFAPPQPLQTQTTPLPPAQSPRPFFSEDWTDNPPDLKTRVHVILKSSCNANWSWTNPFWLLLQRFVKYHMLPKPIYTAALNNGRFTTVEGHFVDIKVREEGEVTVNDASVTDADMSANNGVIHTINRVLMPVSGKRCSL